VAPKTADVQFLKPKDPQEAHLAFLYELDHRTHRLFFYGDVAVHAMVVDHVYYRAWPGMAETLPEILTLPPFRASRKPVFVAVFITYEVIDAASLGS
jgi:hypothetical protein